MTLLLDTNALVWALANRERLSRRAESAVLSGERLLVSPLTIYELAQKVHVGKLELPASPSEFVRRGVESLEASWLPVDFRHTSAADMLPWLHRDPFDRLLALQAIVDDLGLVSADREFDRYGIRRIW